MSFLPKPTFHVVHLEKIKDVDGKYILPEYTNTLLLKLIRMKAFPTLNQDNPYNPEYLTTLEGFLLVEEDSNHYVISPAEYKNQRLVCIISFEEPLDSLQKSRYRYLLKSLFCLHPQTLQAEEENHEAWKKILGKNMCDII